MAPIAWAYCIYSSGKLIIQMAAEKPIFNLRFSSFRLTMPILAAVSVIMLQCTNFIVVKLSDFVRIRWAMNASNEMCCSRESGAISIDTQNAKKDYAKAFERVSEKSSLLVAVDYPFLLNMNKYTIFNIDEPGVASPPPGLPYFKGAMH